MRETLVRPIPPTTPAVATEPANGVNPTVTPKPKRRRRQRMWRMVSPMLVAQVKAWVLKHRRTGISTVARGVKISHAQAVGALKELEAQGVVGPIRMGRNGREILAESPRASERSARMKVNRRRRLARKATAARSRRPAKATVAVPQGMLSELSLSAALDRVDLPQLSDGLERVAKLFAAQRPAAVFLRNLAAVISEIEKLRQLTMA